MSRTIRVTVRGSFDKLSEAQLAELVAARAEHDLMNTAYTAEGYLAYDLPGRPFFTFRFLATAEEQDEIPAITADAEQRAAAWMAERGYPVKNLTAQAVDMSEVPLGSRGKREAGRRR
ncbi:DUF6204 family protein [Actinoplanes subtropicus]|uniref:DUF6204 family protein n=1 Tax=Actinoplanes subtropicus TaxID=543632 RepID=UPI0004C3EEA4|nr:DUF6204 family protein [Actinoplanes subtropicus]